MGPGPGYFSTKIAGVLTRGRLTLADIQEEMLDKAKRRIRRKKLTNVEYYLCEENKEIYISEFHRMLKKDGLLSISELKGDPDKLSIEETRKLVSGQLFTFEKLYGNEDNYTINFRKSQFSQPG